MSGNLKSPGNPPKKVNFCRICGQASETGKILFNFNHEVQRRAVEICSYISIQLKYVRFYPNWICPGCELQLETTSQFFELIRNGQKSLCERFGDLPKRGRRPKKTKPTSCEEVPEAEAAQKLCEKSCKLPRRGRRPKKRKSTSSEDETHAETKDESTVDGDDSKRKPQTPLRLRDTMKGDELEEMYTRIGFAKRTRSLRSAKTKLIAHIQNEEGNSLGKMLAVPKDPQRTCTRYQCIVCKEVFSAEMTFFKHVATHKNIQYECTECESSFTSKSLFDEHQLQESHNGMGIIETPFEDTAIGEMPPATEEHPASTQEVSPSATSKPNTSQVVKSYTCIRCSKSFATKTSMQRHLVTHSNARPFKCDFCGAAFKQRTTLAVHRNSHTRERQFKCSRCSKSFVHQQTLKCHLRIHDGLKPYICAICKKGFRQMVNLVEHRRIHTGERPYVCLICGSAFKTSSQCRTHQRVHKAAEERRPEPIEVDTVHKTHSCRQCNKLFTHKSAMVKHLRTHTGEKPYVCFMCPKTFSDPSNFKKHKKVHAKQNERHKTKSMSLLKRSQPQIAPSCEPDPVEIFATQISSTLTDILDEDLEGTNKRSGLMPGSSDPIISEIVGEENVPELQPSLSNQLVCVSYQDPLNPVTSKTTFYVVN